MQRISPSPVYSNDRNTSPDAILKLEPGASCKIVVNKVRHVRRESELPCAEFAGKVYLLRFFHYKAPLGDGLRGDGYQISGRQKCSTQKVL